MAKRCYDGYKVRIWITGSGPITNSGAGVCVCGAAPPSRPQGDEMEIGSLSELTPEELHRFLRDILRDILRELSNEDILQINRSVLQVMFERNIAAGALDEAIDAERVIWEDRS
jgi:hypothetical protein